ncbi:hypothetical protein [Dyadobacter fanqingshengii]|uniref:Uncharacterized protein n=1 Tax=Dyadobacter fanqingshengii TaxID=2906443 RepID=A0A9X1TBH0_9BACT|nr:hypothetical protein [Dyadobacter fanqingshengii]MCF0043640.1 hypothetical protein [Dyadobacter fanqingshengii]USJ34744.1 hypothetical protein NFI81_18775 [Dyadobacter fanqingshengii]
MPDPQVAIAAEIVDFEIHGIGDLNSSLFPSGRALSASIEVKIGEHYHVFGGPSVFFSMPNDGSDFFGHFVMRCFQVLGVKSTKEMEGLVIKAIFANGKVTAISSIDGDQFFYPGAEFEILEKGKEEAEE